MHAGSMELLNPRDNFRAEPGDKQNGLRLLKKGCDELKVAEACHNYSGVFIKGIRGAIQKNMAEAFTYAKKGCELGNMGACFNVARMYQFGEGTEKDPQKAAAYGEVAARLKKIRDDEAGLPQPKT